MIPKTLEILNFLINTRCSSKIINASFNGDFSSKQLNSKLSRLKKNNLLNRDDLGVWETTQKGRNYYKTRTQYKYFDSKFTKKSRENMLIIFDIPEKERSKRDWLRYQIKQFHYKQIQQSVWYGPSPLPKEFISYLEELQIQHYIKFFKTSSKF